MRDLQVPQEPLSPAHDKRIADILDHECSFYELYSDKLNEAAGSKVHIFVVLVNEKRISADSPSSLSVLR